MSKEKVEVSIQFPNLDVEQLKHLFKAEVQLRKAGIEFDKGFYFPKSIREWSFDWSLKGAEVYLKPPKEK